MREVEAGAKLQLESALTYEEVVKAIKGMKKGTGVGGDKVSAKMLLEGGEILWHNLHALLQVCWEEEFIPGSGWKAPLCHFIKSVMRGTLVIIGE